MGWQRTPQCQMCGLDRCLENRDEPGVGYCYRNKTMHRNGKPFIKKGAKLRKKSAVGNPEGITRTVFGKGKENGAGKERGEKAVSEKGCPPSPSQAGQIEFCFEN